MEVAAGGGGSSAHVRTPSDAFRDSFVAPQKGYCRMGQCREGQFCDLTKGEYRVVKGLRAPFAPLMLVGTRSKLAMFKIATFKIAKFKIATTILLFYWHDRVS